MSAPFTPLSAIDLAGIRADILTFLVDTAIVVRRPNTPGIVVPDDSNRWTHIATVPAYVSVERGQPTEAPVGGVLQVVEVTNIFLPIGTDVTQRDRILVTLQATGLQYEYEVIEPEEAKTYLVALRIAARRIH